MKANKLLMIFFFLNTMMSDLSKYLKKQLGVFLTKKQQKRSQLKALKNGFLSKSFFENCDILSNTYVIKLLKISYFPL